MNYNYEQDCDLALADIQGHTCWPVEWFKEDLPLETQGPFAMDEAVEGLYNKFGQVPGHLLSYVKPKSKEDLALPREQVPAKWKVLVFSDAVGYCKGMFEHIPSTRIAQKKVVEAAELTQEDVAQLVNEQKKGWDLIIFAVGCDPAASNSVPDVIEHNSMVSKLYFWLLQEVQKAETCQRIFTLVRGLFAEDKKTHMQAGLGITASATLFGMTNCARHELEGVAIHFCDTEYFLQDGEGGCNAIFKGIASEAFRLESFGHSSVRILHGGRYVQKQVSSKPYEEANKEFTIPSEGVIAISGGNGALALVMGKWLLEKAEDQGSSGFSILFLSRSCKIADINIPVWEEIQAKAKKLNVHVEQSKMDMSSQEGVDTFLKSMQGNLIGFIHSAGILNDCMLQNLTWDKFEPVYAPKHWAALYLHDALSRISNPKLRFLWLFSSIAVYGNMGQTNYAGSNAFLDALARHRKAKGLPGMAVQWGAWGEVGMAASMAPALRARMNATPLPLFTNAEGLNGLERGLSTGLPYFSVCTFNGPVFLKASVPCDNANQCYARNLASEIVPTPVAPSMDQKHLYTVFRMAHGRFVHRPDVERRVYDSWVKPEISKINQVWGEDFRSW
eukprot:TRINITY_DN30186_c0_g2_i1.p1 TRINITY_DN30186_c0_g2~~TRINITY_DN30186_c0_g2_i1.p1  ORF type:complete len:615 (+),score=132.57 TRINITY_DN30186_c0_g2_i1:55-1899(+)